MRHSQACRRGWTSPPIPRNRLYDDSSAGFYRRRRRSAVVPAPVYYDLRRGLMAPAPYHALYGPGDIPPANRTEAESAAPHPVTAAFMAHGESQCFAEEECRRTVLPLYGSDRADRRPSQGRLFDHLKKTGQWDDTLIVAPATMAIILATTGWGRRNCSMRNRCAFR